MEIETIKKIDDLENIMHSNSEQKKTILVIDDDSAILSLHKDILEIANYDVIAVQDPLFVLKNMDKFSKIDLILLDFCMDNISGLDFINQFEKKWPQQFSQSTVVFMSALDKLPESKAAGFINKLTSIEILLEKIDHFIQIKNCTTH